MAGRPRKVRPEVEASALASDVPVENGVALPAYQRENPGKLEGQALRDLAHRHGMAKSELATMPDEKIRIQLKYVAYRIASES